jgi:hypothetical protein
MTITKVIGSTAKTTSLTVSINCSI